jgi:hypothetical protein
LRRSAVRSQQNLDDAGRAPWHFLRGVTRTEAGGMKARLLFGAVGATLAAMAAAFAQVQFPEGPNRELVVRTCTQCHGLELVMGRNGADTAGWAGTLDEMESNGLSVSPDERAKIIEYLASYLGPNRATPPRNRTEPAT